MLKLGVPSKGRLMDKTFEWFGARGVGLRRTGASREYAGAVEGVAGVELVLLSASEIPRELAAGRIHLGVTGSDLVQETLPDWPQRVVALAPMGFGHADLIVAVPKAWVDVATLDDLDAVSAAFRARHGFRLRIAVTLPFALYSFSLATAVPSLNLLALDCYPGARGMASAMQAFLQLGFSALLALFLVDRLDDHLAWLIGGSLVIWAAAALLWWSGPEARGRRTPARALH